MVRRSRSSSILVPVWANDSSPVRLLPENPIRELYSIQVLDAANSIFIAPLPNVIHPAVVAALNRCGQEVVARGYVSDDTDQSEVWATTAAAAGVRVVVQETVEVQASKPGKMEPPIIGPGKWAARQPFKRESRIM